METHVSWLTEIVNRYLGHFALSLLSALHIQPSQPDTPIPEHVVMMVVVFVIAALFTLWLRPRLSVDNPGGAQQIAELLITNPIGFGIRDLLVERSVIADQLRQVWAKSHCGEDHQEVVVELLRSARRPNTEVA